MKQAIGNGFLGTSLALVAAAAMTIAATPAQARERGAAAKSEHVRSVQRSRGADGLVDSTRTNRRGGTTTVDRYRDSAGNVDATITGPKGGVATVDRSRGADGAVDKVTVGPAGATRAVDRVRNADGTVSKTVTTTPPPAN